MEVILREDIEKLGTRGQIVKVTPGYARNFLLPKRMAVAATEANPHPIGGGRHRSPAPATGIFPAIPANAQCPPR